MFLIRLLTLIFCLPFTTIRTEQPSIIKNPKREKAIGNAVGSFYGAAIVGAIALAARGYAKDLQTNYNNLPLWLWPFAPSLKDSIINARLTCWGATTLSTFLAVKCLYHILDAIFAQPLKEEPKSSFNHLEKSHE